MTTEWFKEQEAQLIRNRDLLRMLKAKGKVLMPQTVCHICGSDQWRHTADYLDGHTLMESQDWCEACDYTYAFNTGNNREVIGRWDFAWYSGHDNPETDEQSLSRRAAREVATLIRRHELNWNFGGMRPFVQALADNPHETSTALVLADWIDEHPDQIDPRSGYQHYPDLLRAYDDASGFAQCPHCGGSGEYYTHSSDCEDDLCALAGGYHDCPGEVVPCDCQHQPPKGTP